ncbi:hypothetical protein, partial [Escherichia albertii]|uniref:hypothetical protein n=1 Tax=Escherichia albertii TaxID=208962 RepID=UPI001FAAEBEE
IRPTTAPTTGRIRRSRRIRLPLPDATLAASYQAYNGANRRSDKAFTPHPTCFSSGQNNSARLPTITPAPLKA